MATIVARHPPPVAPTSARSRLGPLSSRLPKMFAWWIAVAIVMASVGVWQAADRAPLSQDEAAVLASGSRFIFALRSGSPATLWRWIHAQTYYPFATPAIHGLALLGTGRVMAAAWLPTVAVFALVGVAAGRLARSLGAGMAGAWIAAVLCWISPMNVRLAAGAFPENFGALALLGLLLALVRLQRDWRTVDVIGAGAIVVAAWWVKYDYGMAALGFVGAGGLAALVTARRWRAAYPFALAGGSAAFFVLAFFFASNSDGKIQGAGAFLYPPGIERRIDFLYYPRSLFLDLEVGMASVVALLLIFGVAWALVRCRHRPELFPPLLGIAVWLVAYSFAAAKQARFVALIIPVLCALAAVAVIDLRAHPAQARLAARTVLCAVAAAMVMAPGRQLALRLSPVIAVATVLALAEPGLVARARRPARPWAWALVTVLAAPLVWQLTAQLSTLREQLWFVRPDPAASQALAFATENLPASDRPVLLIGESNGFSPQALQLAWDRRLGDQSPGVEVVPEAPPQRRFDALLEAIRRLNPSRLIVVNIGSGSRLNHDQGADGEEALPSQRDYAGMASGLGREGDVLAPVTSRSLVLDPLRIDVWDVRPGALSGFLRVTTSPALPATISVDDEARDTFGVATDLPVGEHKVCFGPVAEYDPPPCRIVTLTAGRTSVAAGTYLPRQGAAPDPADGGFLTVNTLPHAPSQIIVDDIPRDTATVTALKLAPGSHRVCFRYVPGFSTPACRDVVIESGGAASMEVQFRKETVPVRRG